MGAPRTGSREQEAAQLRRANLRLAWLLGGVALAFYLFMILKS